MKSLSLFRILGMLAYPSTIGLYDIPTHLTDREKLTLMRLAKQRERACRQPIVVLEIGAYVGASSTFLASGLRIKESRVLSVDTWTNAAMSEGSRDTMAQFQHNTTKFGDQIVAIRGWSTEPATISRVSQQAESIDMLFIDGDHSYDGVLADWLSYSPLLESGAVIAMHDYGWAEGVQKVVAEHIAPITTDQGSLRNLWWGSLRQ